jgi:hypothetical protein
MNKLSEGQHLSWISFVTGWHKLRIGELIEEERGQNIRYLGEQWIANFQRIFPVSFQTDDLYDLNVSNFSNFRS